MSQNLWGQKIHCPFGQIPWKYKMFFHCILQYVSSSMSQNHLQLNDSSKWEILWIVCMWFKISWIQWDVPPSWIKFKLKLLNHIFFSFGIKGREILSFVVIFVNSAGHKYPVSIFTSVTIFCFSVFCIFWVLDNKTNVVKTFLGSGELCWTFFTSWHFID